MNTRTPSYLWAKKTMFYKEAINGILQLDNKFYIPIMILVKFTSGAYRLKNAMTFFK